MVADLLHYGHTNFMKNICETYKGMDDKFYVGIHNDATVESYKRKPILTMDERIKVLDGFKYIDKIIPDAPLQISDEFIALHGINILCIPNSRTAEDNQLMYSNITDKSSIKIITIDYTYEISTTDIIKRIKNR